MTEGKVSDLHITRSTQLHRTKVDSLKESVLLTILEEE